LDNKKERISWLRKRKRVSLRRAKRPLNVWTVSVCPTARRGLPPASPDLNDRKHSVLGTRITTDPQVSLPRSGGAVKERRYED
jgi:hypothetical protein